MKKVQISEMLYQKTPPKLKRNRYPGLESWVEFTDRTSADDCYELEITLKEALCQVM